MIHLHGKETGAIVRPFFLRLIVIALIALLLAVGATRLMKYLARPCLIIDADNKILAAAQIENFDDFSFSTRFIHSVQKTPVEEFFKIDEKTHEIILESTRYQSFGVGLPFLTSDGYFRREGNHFVMDGMERKMKTLGLRPGVSTKLTLFIGDAEYPLYDMVETGALIQVHVGNNFERLIAHGR